ncbi:MAG: uracil-DNA glycosylase family protein [Aaplasma endosymbiont of Hyalomma asiaticum]
MKKELETQHRKTAKSELAEVLGFYHDSGVNCTLNDELGTEGVVDSNHSKTGGLGIASVTQQGTQAKLDILHWVGYATQVASNCSTLQELKEAVCAFEGCEIKKSAMNTVFSDGNPNAKIMLIGEAPGGTEDREGRPFCGTSGMLLDKMFASINLARTSNIYISNTVFWRPPGNRKPTDFELDVCRPFVERHISLVDPDVVIMVGGTACYSILKTQDNISRLRGRFYNYTNDFLSRQITAMVIFHPAYLLRQPMQKRLAWEDLKMLRAYLTEKNIQTSF